MEAIPVRAAIEIQLGVSPISGHIEIDGGAPLPFSGWLELTAALAAAARRDDALPRAQADHDERGMRR